MHPPRTQSKEVVAPDVFTVKSSAATYAAVMSLYPSTTRFLRPSFLLPSAASGLSDERFKNYTTRAYCARTQRYVGNNEGRASK
jgi:hypothetical protein